MEGKYILANTFMANAAGIFTKNRRTSKDGEWVILLPIDLAGIEGPDKLKYVDGREMTLQELKSLMSNNSNW